MTTPESFRADVETFVREWNDPEPTLVVHTSGSTGAPQPLRVEKTRMAASARMTCDFLGLRPGEPDPPHDRPAKRRSERERKRRSPQCRGQAFRLGIRQLYGDFIDGVENHLLLDPQIFPFPDLFAAVDVPRRAHRKFPGPAAGDAEVVRLLPGEKFR